MRVRSLAAILVLLFLEYGCGAINPPPQCPEPPVWEPPTSEQCHLKDPPAHAECWHQPSAETGWLFICWDGMNVDNPAHCTPKCEDCPACPACPECPACDSCCDDPIPPPVNGDCPAEPKLVAAGDPPPQFHEEVLKATNTLGDLTGGNPNSNLDKLAVQLRIQLPNRCIISGIEAIFIHRDGDKLYEENHAVFFGNGGWTNNGRGKYIGSHRDTSEPVEPPVTGCPLPHPDPDRMKFNIHDAGNHIDTTYTTVNQCEFCESIGLGEHGGVIRCGCPIRPECGPNDPPDAICHEREACEREFIGNQKGWCNNEPWPNHNNNPAQFKACSGRFKTCTEDGKTCSEVDL